MKMREYHNSFEDSKRKKLTWTINVNLNASLFTLNTIIVRDLKLLDENCRFNTMLAQDTEDGSWYITFEGDESVSFKLKIIHNRTINNGRGFTCRQAAAKILTDTKAKTGATFLISKKPVIYNGRRWYRIMTATPLRVN